MTFRRNRGDEEGRKFDTLAHAVTVIEEEHRLIHDGMYFSLNHGFNIGIAGTLDLVITVPAGTFPHLRQWTYALEDGPCTLALFEDPTFVVGGTVITPNNNNRNSPNTPLTTFRADPVISLTGTGLLEGVYIPDPGGGFLSSPGTSAGDESEEWVLKDDEDYLLRLTNNSGSAIDGSLFLSFYEITYDK